MEYFISVSVVSFLVFCFYSYKVLNQDSVGSGSVKRQKYFHMALTWGIILTGFAIFSGIFVLVALFSIMTKEWDDAFLITKIPVFVATAISYVMFSKYKARYKEK